ncbi:Protein ROOT INITIATION DEFECTIVE 3 [Capsicum chinense]|nr:Protein ROOT INITIATION DEFECTIVE 3 [Capsicum chinense]
MLPPNVVKQIGRIKSNRDGEPDEEKSAEGASRKGKRPIIESNLQSKIVGEEDDLEQIQVAIQDFEPYGLDVGNEEDSPRRSMVYPEFESWVEKLMARGVPTGTDIVIEYGGANAIVVSATKDETCKVWSLSKKKLLRNIMFPTIIDSIALDFGEDVFYAGGRDGKIYIATLNIVADPNTHYGLHILWFQTK